MDDICCIYHKDCVDGTTAAAVLLRAFPHARTFPLSHAYTEKDFEEVRTHVSASTHVYIVDCILGLHECLALGCTVTVIDHHEQACGEIAQLEEQFPKLTRVCDPSHSGASLTWSTLFPDEDMPMLVRHVEDGDLWTHAFPETKHVTQYLSIFRNDPVAMGALFEKPLEEVVEKGQVISAYVDTEVENFLRIPPRLLRVGAHTIPAVNITTHESICGNILSERFDSAVILYTVRGNSVKCSIRSRAHQVPNALAVATLLGGGGHPCASGATISWEQFLDMQQAC